MRRNIETESVSRAGNEDHPNFMPAELITFGWLLNVGPTGKKSLTRIGQETVL